MPSGDKYSITRVDGKYIVLRNGEPVHGPVGDRLHAERWIDKARAAAKHRKRKCMRCGEKFMSHGPQKRLCPACNAYAARIHDGVV